MKSKLSQARRIAIVGNGGIALELVYEMYDCQVLWAIKDDAIGNTFFDEGAATFFLPQIETNQPVSEEKKNLMKHTVKRMKYGIETVTNNETCFLGNPANTLSGGALGPDWCSEFSLHGASSKEKGYRQVHVEYKCEFKQLLNPEEFKRCGEQESPFPLIKGSSLDSADWQVYIQLSNGKIYGCDFIVSATGVVPNTQSFVLCAPFETAEDGGLLVNSNMQTNIEDIYAAGDVCTTGWDPAPHWLQMRLWSQARQMGMFAAKSIMAHFSNEKIPLDFCFELFTHVTQFFGYKVVLLGKFNAQGLGNDYELLLRYTKGEEYVKVVLHEDRMCGAVLIGETDLEETFENLILNQTDLSAIKDILLNPEIDIEDYFD